jgi:hypothetical protein
VYFWGNQPEFRTALVGGESRSGQLTAEIHRRADSRNYPSTESDAPTRIVLLPRFAETGLVTLINIASRNLECKTVSIGIPEWDKKTKVELSEEEVEAERARTAVVRSDLDMMNDEGGDW